MGNKDGKPQVYVGESEDVSARIRTHDANKDWWSEVVIITTAANNLHKAHVKYLESRLVEEARKVGRTDLENGNTPPRSSLSEAAQSNMEVFLDTLFIVLPALRIDTFLSRARPAMVSPEPRATAVPQVAFELKSSKAHVHAQAVLQDGEFIVQAGSTARKDWAGVDYATYRLLYLELRDTGVLQQHAENCVFTQNYAFPSASAASSVVLGRSSNGTIEWTVAGTSISYKSWEADLLATLGGGNT